MSEFNWLDERKNREVREELDRRHPERVGLRPSDVAGMRDAFDAVEAMWAPTLARARRLPPEQLHERVGGEYSFIETLRHLLFATDAWITRLVLRVPNGFHEFGVAPDVTLDEPMDDGPDLDAVLEVRAERSGRIRDYLAHAEDADLASEVSSPDKFGFPPGNQRVVACFRLVLNEEWWHHGFAVRDLAVLERDG